MSKPPGWYRFVGYDANGESIAIVNGLNFDVAETKMLEVFRRLEIATGSVVLFKNGVLRDAASIRTDFMTKR